MHKPTGTYHTANAGNSLGLAENATPGSRKCSRRRVGSTTARRHAACHQGRQTTRNTASQM
eukprot:7232579-Lingulodinium_polyedra.AAC.1